VLLGLISQAKRRGAVGTQLTYAAAGEGVWFQCLLSNHGTTRSLLMVTRKCCSVKEID
jgi:hypothetical protein